MARVATIRLSTPRPTSVDEEVALFDDGSAYLVVRRGTQDGAAVGTYRCATTADEQRALAGAGPELAVDLLHPPTEGAAATAFAVANTVAARARATPHAVARFHARLANATTVAVAVVGEGDTAVRFELAPDGLVAHFFSGGREQSWVELAAPATGFITPEAAGLGGLRGPAVVAPSAYGVLSMPVSKPDGADAIQVQLAGTLTAELPDAPDAGRFEARTEPAPL